MYSAHHTACQTGYNISYYIVRKLFFFTMITARFPYLQMEPLILVRCSTSGGKKIASEAGMVLRPHPAGTGALDIHYKLP